MFDDFNGICYRSWNSAGKVTIWTPYFGRSINSEKISEVPIFSDDEGSQKGESRWATMGPDLTQARALVWPRWVVSGYPGPPPMKPLLVYLPNGKPKIGGSSTEIFRHLCGAENHEE